MTNAGLYIDLWKENASQIIKILELETFPQSITMNKDDFSKVGSRKKYSFNLEYKNGIVSNNTDGTAVARDLARVLESSKKVMSCLEFGHYKFNMGKAYVLKINKLSE